MYAIFAVSGLSAPPGLPGGLSDTAGHVAAYALLAVLAARALAGGRWAGLTGGALAGAWLVASAYGATDEWRQSFVPGRTATVVDWVADSLGAALGLAALWAAARLARRGRPGRDRAV
jgi:VanZ family protein